MKLKLIQRKPETADVESFIFEPDQSIRWQAGQYLHYSLPHIASDDGGLSVGLPFLAHLMKVTLG